MTEQPVPVVLQAPATAAGSRRKTTAELFLARIVLYEHWPFWLLFFPAVVYAVWYMIRSRSVAFFTAVNPGIELGGFFGESKSAILDKIPQAYKPVTMAVGSGTAVKDIIHRMAAAGLSYPVVCKPDRGEMGYKVAVIDDDAALTAWCAGFGGPFIVQEYVDLPLELGILYFRMPDGSGSGITSVVRKEFLAVTGDGRATVSDLLRQTIRGGLQEKAFRRRNPSLAATVLPPGRRQVLEPIGNHCRGTTFLDARDLAGDRLVRVFDTIAEGMEGFYYGRFDLKTSNRDDLAAGRNIRIMEVNGVTSEPAHIYDPTMRLRDVYADLFADVRLLFRIARMNRARGVRYASFGDVWHAARHHFRSKRNNGR